MLGIELHHHPTATSPRSCLHTGGRLRTRPSFTKRRRGRRGSVVAAGVGMLAATRKPAVEMVRDL